MSERIPANAVQSAVYTALATPLNGLSTAIPLYAYTVPADVTYPFAVISQVACTPSNTKSSFTQDVVVTVQVYVQATTATLLNTAVNTILATYTNSDLTLSDNFRDVGVDEQEAVEFAGTVEIRICAFSESCS